ncbi:MAG: hypothetical protein B7Z47_02100 [Chthoniobacter sp. 12-60-6]|nr:MAG: hypothetical protein B7Z47_02100 [Chthoniobacter sp. 12-60-6]
MKKSMFLAAICLALTPSLFVLTAQEVAKVSLALPFDTKGKVELTAAAPADSAVQTTTPPRPTVITAGGKISTDESGSAAVTLGGLGTVQMERNTEIQIPAEADAAHSLELLKGKLFLQINAEELQKKNAGEFRLKTPASLLAVKGTRFFVDCDRKSETVGLHEGKVLVTESAGKGTAELLPGQAVTVSPGSISSVGPLSTKDKYGARVYDTLTLTRTPLLITFDARAASGVGGQQVPMQYFHEGRLLAEPPGNLNDWEYLRFYNFFSSGYQFVNGQRVAADTVSPLSITPEGAVVMATEYRYKTVSKRVKGKTQEAQPVLGDLVKSVRADIHFKGRAWRSMHTGKADVGPLLGLQLRLRVTNVGRVTSAINTSSYGSSIPNAVFEAPPGLPEGGVWERECVLPVKLDKTGEDSRYTLHLNLYPEGPTDAAGNLRSGTAELTILDCALVSKSR